MQSRSVPSQRALDATALTSVSTVAHDIAGEPFSDRDTSTHALIEPDDNAIQ